MQLKAPRSFKFKKHHKGKVQESANVVNNFNHIFGDFCIVTAEPGRISARQIEAARKAIRKVLKRTGKLWVPIFPQTPITAKPLEVRMGKGKGAVSHWVAKTPAGSMIIGLSNVPFRGALKALGAAQTKLPVRSQLIFKDMDLEFPESVL